MLEMKYVGDNFEMWVTDSTAFVTKITELLTTSESVIIKTFPVSAIKVEKRVTSVCRIICLLVFQFLVSEVIILALSVLIHTFDEKLNTFQHSFDLCHSDKVESLSRPECKH